MKGADGCDIFLWFASVYTFLLFINRDLLGVYMI